ncbi:MAG: DUF3592 domain-containing protein, partial [Rubrivivax sp.]|nr:DUF3592 domain-containing protein [Pyrinomonadaceae bacterium]
MFESLTAYDLLAPGIILAGAFLIFLLMALIAAAQWRKVAAARRWPVARGTILESRVAESNDSDGGLDYRAVITYQYQVGGQGYINNLLAFGARSLMEGGVAGEKKAYATVARYPVGGHVEVHYHPERPAESVLEIRSAVAKLLVIFGLVF